MNKKQILLSFIIVLCQVHISFVTCALALTDYENRPILEDFLSYSFIAWGIMIVATLLLTDIKSNLKEQLYLLIVPLLSFIFFLWGGLEELFKYPKEFKLSIFLFFVLVPVFTGIFSYGLIAGKNIYKKILKDK